MEFGELRPEGCRRALDARDARFDGVFFVGITGTRIYCRPVCPARVSNPGYAHLHLKLAIGDV